MRAFWHQGAGRMPLSLDHREHSSLGLTASDWSVVAMVLIVKAMVLIYGALSFQITMGERVRTLTHMLSIWNRWDGPQYLLIAQHGYGVAGDQRLALVFFPLYPWLIRLVAFVVRDPVVSAFAISTIASLVALEFPESPAGSLKLSSLLALGFILFVISFIVLAISRTLLRPRLKV